MPDNLELISTEDLIKELQKRFAATIFCGCKPTKISNNKEVDNWCYWSGGPAFALGLIEYNKRRLLKSLDTSKDISDGE